MFSGPTRGLIAKDMLSRVFVLVVRDCIHYFAAETCTIGLPRAMLLGVYSARCPSYSSTRWSDSGYRVINIRLSRHSVAR